MLTARQTAFEILSKIKKDNVYSDLVTNQMLDESSLSKQDRALVTLLVSGVTERAITLDKAISLCIRSRIHDLSPNVLTALRIGAYQLMYTDRIPDYAAINSSVDLVKKYGPAKASGLVNAVLRKISAGVKLPNDPVTMYSVPSDILDIWESSYGKDTALMLAKDQLEKKPVFFVVNTLKTTPGKLASELSEQGFEIKETSEENVLSAGAFPDTLSSVPQFINGDFFVQDISCYKALKSLDLHEGQLIYDLCAAPGGKSFSCSILTGGKAFVKAFDISGNRAVLIKQGAQRMGFENIEVKQHDASRHDSKLLPADIVLCDVPCSGLGVVSRKPEIKYKDVSSFEDLIKLQKAILENGASYCKAGSELLYSTCTLSKSENEDVAEAFLKAHPEFDLKQMNTIFPYEFSCDGFFFACFKEKSE